MYSPENVSLDLIKSFWEFRLCNSKYTKNIWIVFYVFGVINKINSLYGLFGGLIMFHKVKESLDGLKDNQQLDYEWSKLYAGSLILKNPSKELDEIIHLLGQNIKDNIQEELSFNRFNPTEFGNTKFIIIHKENIESTLDYSKFKSKFKIEINDDELTNKADNWIAQFPFFDWKIYALKLLSNITYFKMDKIDKSLEEIKNYISGLNGFVISDIEGIEKSSVHLFYSLNKLIEDPKFVLSQNLDPSDSRSIVFIDDMIGTGHQATNYVKKLKNDKKIGYQKLYYYAIFGLEDGINEIKKSGLFEIVLTTEQISNTAFDTGYIFTAEESGVAKEMASTIGEQLTKGLDKIGPLGYENSGALVFFRYNSPNNSLPIFWASGKCKILEPLGEHTEVNWTPLFPRKEKPKTVKPESAFVKPKSNVPLQNPFFTGREIYIEKLHEALKSDGAAALSQPQAISGYGGIGKTETAIKYAHKYKNEYKEVFWVNADSTESLISSFVNIAGLLNLSVKDNKEQDLIVDAVKHRLETDSGWLLIFDNADNPKLVKDFIPLLPKGHIILTSRAQIFSNLGIMDPIKMDEMSPDESKKFLLIRTGRNKHPLEQIEIDAIEQLGEKLDHFPLALEQAGAYIYEKSSTFNDYLISYRKRGIELLEKTKSDRYLKTVATTWSLNFEQVEQTSNAAIDLLYVSAFLNPYSIPLKLIAQGANELGPVLCESLADVDSNPLALDEVLDPLNKYSLISRDPGSPTYSIHRMIQAVLKDRMENDIQRKWVECTIKAVDKAFPEVEFKTWNICEAMIPHAKTCLELIEKSNFEFQEAARLLNKAGNYLKARALYDEAKLFFEQALGIRKKVFEGDNPDLAETFNDFAGLYLYQGRYKEAEEYYDNALAIRKKLGDEHPDLAETFNDFAGLYRYQGKYKEAEEYYDNALAIRKKLGDEHPDLAETFNDFAGLYQNQGKYKEAEKYYDNALAIWKKLGDEHPDIAATFNNLGLLYHDQGKYEKAEEFYNNALNIEKKVLGEDHPDIAATFNNLGSLYHDQGKYEKAEEFYNNALNIEKKVLGEDHPDIAITLINLGSLYQAQRKYSKAKSHFKQAVEIVETSFGKESPLIVKYLIDYANFLMKINKKREGQKIKSRVKAIQNKQK